MKNQSLEKLIEYHDYKILPQEVQLFILDLFKNVNDQNHLLADSPIVFDELTDHTTKTVELGVKWLISKSFKVNHVILVDGTETIYISFKSLPYRMIQPVFIQDTITRSTKLKKEDPSLMDWNFNRKILKWQNAKTKEVKEYLVNKTPQYRIKGMSTIFGQKI